RLNVPGLARSHGWWNRIIAGDFTGSGHTEFIVGNLGLNGHLHASVGEPVQMYVNDFDHNGIVEQIVTEYNGGTSYPVTLRDDLIRALPYLKAHYPGYRQYAGQRITDVFTAAELDGAVVDTVETFATSLVRNDGHGRLTLVALPRDAQTSPVYGIAVRDLDGDGHPDLLIAGNFDGFKPEYGRMAAMSGLALRGDPSRCRAQDVDCEPFAPLRAAESGFYVPGQTRDIAPVRTRAGTVIVVARNNDRPLFFRPAGASARPTTLARR
ncbi:MAG TPA: VCBS repeat-containing protein, partial [Gemmatirosa sp.]